MDKEIIHDRENERFYISDQQGEAEMNYSLKGDTMEIYHTFVPPALRGRGIAGLISEQAALTAEKQGWKIKPSCRFMEMFLKKNREYTHLKK